MLKVESLACRRSARMVFRDVTFGLEPGALLLVRGVNGSGKSSLLRILAGLLPTAEGQIFWQNTPVADDPESHRERLHYIGHLDGVKPELTVRETLDYWQTLQAPDGRVKSFSDPFGMNTLAEKSARILSAGQKRKLCLTRLALNDAPLWLLDEPSAGLDSAGFKILSDLIATHRAKGGIVIAAMHDPMDAPDSQTFTMPERRV